MIPRPLPAWVADFKIVPTAHEGYYSYLERAIGMLDHDLGGRLLEGATLAERFAAGELIVPQYRAKREPPGSLFPNLVTPLALALLLRQTMVAQGFGPLVVVATYRPAGGAGKSRHKVNAALDLKPARLTRAACRAMMVGAAWIYRTHAHLQVGVGTYGPHTDRTTLVHLDAGQRPARTSWRQIKGVPVATAIPHQLPAPWEAPT